MITATLTLTAVNVTLTLGTLVALGRARSRGDLRRAASSHRCTTCRHGLGMHAPPHGACNAGIRYGFFGDYWRPCGCLHYVGERPLELGT